MDAKILGPISSGGNNNGVSDALLGAIIGSNQNNGGGLFSGNGNGLTSGLLGFFIGALANGGWNGGGGLFGGGNNNAVEQAQNYLMEAINHRGEAQTTALANLAATLNADFNLVQTTFLNVSDKLCAMANSITTTGMQTQATVERTGASITAGINSGFQSLAGQISGGFRDITMQAAQNHSADILSDCQNKHDIIEAINANGRAAIAKMDAIEDARKDREIAELQRKPTQSETEKYVGQALGPVFAGLNAVAKQVSDIACKLPQTVTLPYSGLTVVPNWQAQVGADIVGSAIANRFFPSQADAAAGTTTTTQQG